MEPFSQFVVLFALIAATGAVVVPAYQSHQPTLFKAYQPAQVIYKAAPGYKQEVYPDTPAEYEFSYEVNDEHTGDVKSQKESRKGDDVQGEYSLIDADGYRRTVTYTADEHNGFLATVHREPIEGHQVAVPDPVYKYVAPIVKVATPVYKYVAPVVKYTAPVQQVAYSAPAYKVSPVVYAANGAHSQVSFHGPAHDYHY
jgi:hypothetical protein